MDRTTAYVKAGRDGRRVAAEISAAVYAQQQADVAAYLPGANAACQEWAAAADVAEAEAVSNAVAAFRAYRAWETAVAEQAVDRAVRAALATRSRREDRQVENPRGRDRSIYSGMRCEMGWTGDRCTKKLGHRGFHSNE